MMCECGVVLQPNHPSPIFAEGTSEPARPWYIIPRPHQARKQVISTNITNTDMIKMLEIIGFAAIGGTIYAFLGLRDSELRWPVFLACVGIAIAVIAYRKKIREGSREQ